MESFRKPNLNSHLIYTSAMNLPQLLKSRTVWFAMLLAVLSIAQGYIGLLPLTPVHQMLVGCAIAVCITLLRIVTTTPIAEK